MLQIIYYFGMDGTGLDGVWVLPHIGKPYYLPIEAGGICLIGIWSINYKVGWIIERSIYMHCIHTHFILRQQYIKATNNVVYGG